jgi:hypothetical protein
MLVLLSVMSFAYRRYVPLHRQEQHLYFAMLLLPILCSVLLSVVLSAMEHNMTVAHHPLQRLPLLCIEMGFGQDGLDVSRNDVSTLSSVLLFPFTSRG